MEFLSDAAIGPFGYTVDKGLIPLSEDERAAQRRKARSVLTSDRIKRTATAQ